MAPLLPPGTFVPIDAKQARIRKSSAKKGMGQSPFARPIYFLDIRTGYACDWCEIKDGQLTLIPHPDSGEQTRTFRYPSEVEVVGRVTGIAMRIGEKSRALIEEAIPRRKAIHKSGIVPQETQWALISVASLSRREIIASKVGGSPSNMPSAIIFS